MDEEHQIVIPTLSRAKILHSLVSKLERRLCPWRSPLCLEGIRDGWACSRTGAAAAVSAATVVSAAAAVVVARGVAVAAVSVAGAAALPAVFLLHWHFAGPGAGGLAPVFAVASGLAGSGCYRASVAVAGIFGPAWDCRSGEGRASRRA